MFTIVFMRLWKKLINCTRDIFQKNDCFTFWKTSINVYTIMFPRTRLNKFKILLSKNLLESKLVRKKRQDMKSIESVSAKMFMVSFMLQRCRGVYMEWLYIFSFVVSVATSINNGIFPITEPVFALLYWLNRKGGYEYVLVAGAR